MLDIRALAADQGRVFDVADPDRHGKVIKVGDEVSEVRFEDGAERNVPNDHLRPVEPPTETDGLDNPTHNLEAVAVRDGQQAWVRLRDNSTWDDWLTVGAAHVVGRLEAMRDAHTNKPEGRGYCAGFSAWAKKFGFNDLDKGDRARLFNVMDHVAEIEAWRNKLSFKERLRLNHPASVWRRWKASVKAASGEQTEKKISSAQKLKDSIASLQEDNDRMRREIERGGGDLFSKDDRPRDIAQVMIAKLGKSKAEKLADEIRKALKGAMS